MEMLETVWRFAVTGLAVWRLSRLLYKSAGNLQAGDVAGEDSNSWRFWAGRGADLLCWASVWMSSQTAIWVACGFGGVFVSWITLSGISRLFARVERESGEMACLAGGDGMQAHHG
jgi:hypothetical protein